MNTRKPSWITDPRAPAVHTPPLACIVALKAVAQGSATEDQQRRFMEWLVKDVCGYGQCPAYFGEDAALKSYLAMGRHRVAEVLKTYIETPIGRFKDGPSEQVT